MVPFLRWRSRRLRLGHEAILLVRVCSALFIGSAGHQINCPRLPLFFFFFFALNFFFLINSESCLGASQVSSGWTSGIRPFPSTTG
ncbi:hypothetical protein LY78DRAFT_414052 [Colletotrichum sublineola]|nr:hypothetical protein LY78DRAFT_414052 [Colletotrichum sublineola]